MILHFNVTLDLNVKFMRLYWYFTINGKKTKKKLFDEFDGHEEFLQCPVSCVTFNITTE